MKKTTITVLILVAAFIFSAVAYAGADGAVVSAGVAVAVSE